MKYNKLFEKSMITVTASLFIFFFLVYFNAFQQVLSFLVTYKETIFQQGK